MAPSGHAPASSPHHRLWPGSGERGRAGPEGIRTPDLAVKSRLLYRPELRARDGAGAGRSHKASPGIAGARTQGQGAVSPGDPFESGPDHERQEQGDIALHGRVASRRLDLPPGDRLAGPGAREAPVPFHGRREVERRVQSAPELVPPDRVVLRDPAAEEDRAGALRSVDEVGELLLVRRRSSESALWSCQKSQS